MLLYNINEARVSDYSSVVVHGIRKRPENVVSFSGTSYYPIIYENDIPDEAFYTYTESGRIEGDTYIIFRTITPKPISQLLAEIEAIFPKPKHNFTSDDITHLLSVAAPTLHARIMAIPTTVEAIYTETLSYVNHIETIQGISDVEELRVYYYNQMLGYDVPPE